MDTDDEVTTTDVTTAGAHHQQQVSADVQRCCADILDSVLLDIGRFVHSKGGGDSSVSSEPCVE